MLDQRQRRWADVVQNVYKCVVFSARVCLLGAIIHCTGGGGGGGEVEFLSRANYLFQPGSAAHRKFHILLHVYIEQFLK